MVETSSRLSASCRLALALAVSTAALPAVPAFAQGPERRAEAREATPAHWIIDRLDARIAQLKADLRLTEDQNRHWDAFRKALHDVAAARVQRPAGAQGAPQPQPQDKDKDKDKRQESERQGAQTSPAPAEQARGPDTTQATSPRQAPQGRLDRTAPPLDEDEDGDARMRDERRFDRRDQGERSPADWRRRDGEARREPARRMREDEVDALADMQEMADAMRERAEDLQKVVAAARPLYESLDRRQQRMVIRFVQREWASGEWARASSGMLHPGAFGGREEGARERR